VLRLRHERIRRSLLEQRGREQYCGYPMIRSSSAAWSGRNP
jgi:hypothetical protein